MILGFDENTGKKIYEYMNPHKKLFTSLCWNS